MSAQITNFQLQLAGATWIDVNSQFTANNLPDRIPDVLAVKNSLFNIFNCPIGSRSRIFQPQYGCLWIQFLQEPIDTTTATKIQLDLLQALAKWEPRISVDFVNSGVVPDLSLPGYYVTIAFALNLNLSVTGKASFQIQQ